ncbi:SDR family oxidoreductase [Streptosporangium subroseum]|uniref:SDR family oxidoreductase n=1 Tax=Streptosporangium subroseum TaxID=106412 RepID=UPI00308FA918|nr:SDR family oxidoreductase [Streptosporangium subroseum]
MESLTARSALNGFFRHAEDGFRLEGKAVIVTGAASGIGRSTAMRLVALRARVVLVDQEAEGLASLAAELPPDHCRTITGDLSDADLAESAVEVALHEYGSIDSVVFAAGRRAIGNIADLSYRDFMASLETNVGVHFRLSRAILRHFQRLAPQRAACSLVYIVSKAAVAPSVGFGGYPIAKAAQLQLARVVAIEGAKYGVRANVVNPGAVFEGSRFWDEELVAEKAISHNIAPENLETYYARRTMLGLRVTPAEVAETVAFLVSPLSGATTGAIIPVDGGLPATFGR